MHGTLFEGSVGDVLGGWGRGFVIPLGQRYPMAKSDYEDFCHPYQVSNERRNELMGQACLSEANENLFVANIIGQYFYSRNQKSFSDQNGVDEKYLPTPEGRFVCYDSIQHGFRQLIKLMGNTPFCVQMPKMGCDLAGGDWKVIEGIIIEGLSSKDIQVTVYELLFKRETC